MSSNNNDNNDFWVRIWAIIAFTVIVVTAMVVAGVNRHAKVMAENGYEQVTLPRTSGMYWRKATPESE